MLTTVDELTKSIMAVMHQAASPSGRECLGPQGRRATKTRLRLGGSLTIQDAKDLVDQKAKSGEAVQQTPPDSSDTGGLARAVL